MSENSEINYQPENKSEKDYSAELSEFLQPNRDGDSQLPKRYINLIETVKLNGLTMALPLYSEVTTKKLYPPEEEERYFQEFVDSKKFSGAIIEGMNWDQIGLTSEMVVQYRKIRDKLRKNEAISVEEFEFVKDFYQRLEKLFQYLLDRGFSAKQIRQ